MATNNITSNKVPKRRGKSGIREAGVPMYVGDDLLEKGTGDMGRLATIQAQPVTNLSTSSTNRLLAKAGIRVNRGTS